MTFIELITDGLNRLANVAKNLTILIDDLVFKQTAKKEYTTLYVEEKDFNLFYIGEM